MKFTLGFSPCPNDTFIFDALVNKKIDTEGFDFDVMLEDVQTLNQWALQQKLDITKISYGVLPLILNDYNLLDAGGALGKGVGPLLISKKEIDLDNINDCSIAIPGKNTTAHLLFSLAFPKALNKKFMIFSEIEQAVLSGKVDAGVIIHENRFTYKDKGLIKLIDLGEFWEQETGCPIPLGGIVMKKDIDINIHRQINALLKKSVEYSFKNYPLLSSFVKQHSQEMDERVMRQHIDLYVNNYSVSLGEDGKKAIETLLSTYTRINTGLNAQPISFIQ
jgi:1,4-dihydroxy-6-naphthoate synthase